MSQNLWGTLVSFTGPTDEVGKKKKAFFLIHHVYDIACVQETHDIAWHVNE